jgi:hypothetical protein
MWACAMSARMAQAIVIIGAVEGFRDGRKGLRADTKVLGCYPSFPNLSVPR